MIELSIYSGFSLFKKMHRESMEGAQGQIW